jgi:hypothetical protein
MIASLRDDVDVVRYCSLKTSPEFRSIARGLPFNWNNVALNMHALETVRIMENRRLYH